MPCCGWQLIEYVYRYCWWMHEADVEQNTHTQVKTRILERMTEWAEMFSSNPDLGIMEQAYSRLKSQSEPARRRAWPDWC